MLLTIIVFILILGVLIFAHEFGHFILAKRAGIRVDEFGFGFPPRIFGIKKGETIYSLNLIPLGGFVRIFGEEGPERGRRRKLKRRKDEKRAFYNKSIGKRAIIIAAGVIMNLILAGLLLSLVHGVGVPTIVEEGQTGAYRDIQIQIVGVASDSPAAEAGIRMGDTINELKVKFPPTADQPLAEKVNELEDVSKFVAVHVGEEITLVIRRGNEVLEKTLTPRVSPPEGEGAMGIAMAKVGTRSYPWHSAIWQGFKTTGRLTATFVILFYQLLKNLIIRGVFIGEVAGPVGIAVLVSQVTKLGFVYILQFTAILSINLAIINAIPFPALDGGRLLFLGIEKIKGSPVSPKVERAIHAAGFALLIALMVLVTFRDIVKLF